MLREKHGLIESLNSKITMIEGLLVDTNKGRFRRRNDLLGWSVNLTVGYIRWRWYSLRRTGRLTHFGRRLIR